LELALPQVEIIESEEGYGRFSAEPLEKGFGTTLGNTLRRVLLSYLPGAAVTSLIIEGIQHEFSPIPNVKEDTMELLLNIKALRIKSLSGRPGKLILEASGEKEITAADIKHSVDFEIVNPDLYLATLDSPESNLYMELDVTLGRGYQSADSSDGLVVGAIPVDAIFSPIRKVNFNIEPIHVGRVTSRERLVLEVWTDGTITPSDAVSQAAEILIKHLNTYAIVGGKGVLNLEVAEKGPIIPEEKFNMPVEQLDLSVRTMNCLRHAGIATVGEILQTGRRELMSLRNFGSKSLQELEEKLATTGLSLNELDIENNDINISEEQE
jgi:DNA-directed RNA polymerase subunit alpha